MKKPHKHAELIKAWADGAEIQWYDNSTREHRWFDCAPNRPSWCEKVLFRVKPEPKPDVVRWVWATTGIGEASFADFEKSPNLKLTIDGETGKLKSAEVL